MAAKGVSSYGLSKLSERVIPDIVITDTDNCDNILPAESDGGHHHHHVSIATDDIDKVFF